MIIISDMLEAVNWIPFNQGGGVPWIPPFFYVPRTRRSTCSQDLQRFNFSVT